MKEELHSVLRKIKIEKQLGLMKDPPRSMEDQGIQPHTAPILMLYITKTQ